MKIGNGQESLEMLKVKDFDLILMDCHMPVLDGFEATKEIRKNDKFKNIYILAVTASSMKKDIDQCFEVGMDSFLAKPYTSNDLAKAINTALLKIQN